MTMMKMKMTKTEVILKKSISKTNINKIIEVEVEAIGAEPDTKKAIEK